MPDVSRVCRSPSRLVPICRDHQPRSARSSPRSCQTVGMPQRYWLDLFTVETWKEFLDHGGTISGLSDKRWATVQKIKPGDYLLCYLTPVSAGSACSRS